MNNIIIGNIEYPKSGWAIIFAGGSSSGKSSLIRSKRLLFTGESLSTDTIGEEIIEVHNHAKKYAKEDPKRFKEAERLIEQGRKGRYGEVGVQNIHIDLGCRTFAQGKMSTILSNGAHAQKEAFFKRKIQEATKNDMANLLLDMTGKEKEVTLYTDYLKGLGYKVALLWVIANRSQAIIWNNQRPRSMKVGAVHTGHDDPNKYLLDYLQDGRAKDLDDVWFVFNTTESLSRPMTDEEQDAIQLEKDGGRFIIPSALSDRVKTVCGPNQPERGAEDTSSPQWQKDESGKQPLIVDDAFMEKYTAPVTLADGRTARALLQLRAISDPKQGGLVVRNDKTGEPKLQKCNKADTPTYPYVLIDDSIKGKKIQRRHGMMSGYRLKYEKPEGSESPYVSDEAIDKLFCRYRMMGHVAREQGVDCPPIEQVIVSFLKKDAGQTEANFKAFYTSIGIKEPKLPKKPAEVYDVNEPVREQFKSDAAFDAAVKLYPEQKAAYERACQEWDAYDACFK